MKTPIKNKMLLGGAVLMLATKSVLAQDTVTDNRGDLYKSCELSVDGFGTASLGQYTFDHLSGSRVRHNGRLGAGVGLNYFFTRNIGVGTDVYSENTSGTWVDSGSANLIARFPLGQSGFAPYAFGGGGRHFDEVRTWFFQAGGGVEYRFTPNWGLFLDGRVVQPDKTKLYGVARLGVRFAF